MCPTMARNNAFEGLNQVFPTRVATLMNTSYPRNEQHFLLRRRRKKLERVEEDFSK